MLAYYGSRISEHMTRTPEGFLICRAVPIARLGKQKYLPDEIGISGETHDSLVDVYRVQDEVFSSAAMASFEGKPVTLEHPPVTVTPENSGMYAKGHAQNVRRGSGPDSDLLVADLFIIDADLIREIENGLREISCGYECDYDQDAAGHIIQSKIRGNHVAIVAAGRAGARVSIKDSAPEPKIPKGVTKPMSKKKPSVFSQMVANWVRDAEPEEAAAVIDEMMADPDQADPTALDEDPIEAVVGEQPAPAAPVTDGDEELKQLLRDAIAAMTGKPADPVDALADEVAGGEELPVTMASEEEVTVPAEEMMDAEVPNPDQGVENLPEITSGTISRDSAATIAVLNAMKPYLSMLPPKQKKACTDSMTAAYRKAMGKPAKATNDNYAGIMRIQRQTAKRRTADSAKNDDSALGKSITAKFNPHYKTK